MSGSVGQIDLDLGLNYGEFNQQLNGIAGKASGMVGGAFKRLGGIIAGAFAVGAIVNFGREAINLASDLQEVQNVVDVTFGSMSAEIDDWSKSTLTAFGLSELSAKRYSSTIGAMMKSSGLAGVQMKDMSKKLTELSADMASFYNLSNDMAFEKIRSGISGETEPLKQLGINMSVANMEAFALSQGITKSYQAMNQAEQTLLRYNYLLSVTKDAQGDFARTSGSWANQVKLMGEQWRIFQGTMGAGFINILTPIVKGLNFIIRKLQIAAEYFKAFTELIFGNAAGVSSATGAAAAATSDVADSMGGMGAATQDAGKKVKKAGKDVKGSLAGFDQLNTLTQATASAMGDAAAAAGSAGAVGGVDLGSMTTGEIDLGLDTSKIDAFKESLSSIKDIAAIVGQSLRSIFGPPIQAAIAEITPVLGGWKEQFKTMFSDIMTLGAPLANWIITGLIPLWQQGIELAGHVFAGLLDSVLMVVNSIWEAAFPIIDKFITEGLPRITEFLTGAMEIFRSLFDLVKQIFNDIWQGVVDPVMQLISKIIQEVLDIIFFWWDDWGKKIVDGIKTALDNIKKLWENLWNNFLKPFIEKMLEMLEWLWDKHLKGLVEELTKFIGKLVDGALEIFNKFIMPIINWLVEKLGPTFSDIFAFIGDVLGTVLGVIIDVVKGILKALGGVIDFIVGVFTGDWEKAWNGIKDFFGGIFDGVVAIFKGAVNLIIDALNWLIRQLNKVKIDIPDWAAELSGMGKGGTFGFNIPTIPKLAKGGLAYGPTLAMVGDNKGASADPEVISPLSKLQEMLGGSNQAVVEALYMILETLRSNGNRETVLKIGETELGRVAARAIGAAERQAGRALFAR